MTDPQDLLRLADEIEKATGHDRRLDAAVAVAAKQVPHDFEPASIGFGSWRSKYDDRWWEAPAYTASLDAAMTLIPAADRWHTRLAMEDRHSHSWRWELRGGFGWDAQARAATPTLALCAAALKARAHSTKDSSNG